MFHKKVSGVANGAAEKVGGGDWDDAHVYGPGEIVQVAFGRVIWDPANAPDELDFVASSRVTGTPVRLSSGSYLVDIDISGIQVKDGCVLVYEFFPVQFFPRATDIGMLIGNERIVVTPGILPYGFSFISPGSVVGDPTTYFDFKWQLMAEVVAE